MPHGFTQEGASRPHTHVDQVYWTPTPQGGPRLGPASGWLNTQEKPHGIPTYNVRMPHGFTQEGASRPHTYVDQDHGHLPPKVDPGLAQLTPSSTHRDSLMAFRHVQCDDGACTYVSPREAQANHT